MKKFAKYQGDWDGILATGRTYLIHVDGVEDNIEGVKVEINHGMWMNIYTDYEQFNKEWKLI